MLDHRIMKSIQVYQPAKDAIVPGTRLRVSDSSEQRHVPNNSSNSRSSDTVSTSLVYCSYCYQPLVGGSKFCSNCGGKIVANVCCPNCNKIVKLAASFCGSCGARLLSSTSGSSSSSNALARELIVHLTVEDLNTWYTKADTEDEHRMTHRSLQRV